MHQSGSNSAAKVERAGSSRSHPLSAADAAAYLGVSERWIRRAVAERRLSHIKMGRLLRFLPADLDAYVAARRVEGRPW